MSDADDDPCVYVSTALPSVDPEYLQLSHCTSSFCMHHCVYVAETADTLLPAYLLSNARYANISNDNVNNTGAPIQGCIEHTGAQEHLHMRRCCQDRPFQGAHPPCRRCLQASWPDQRQQGTCSSSPSLTTSDDRCDAAALSPDGPIRWMLSPEAITERAGIQQVHEGLSLHFLGCRGRFFSQASQQMIRQLTMQNPRERIPSPSSAGALGASVPCWGAGSCALPTTATPLVQPRSSFIHMHMHLQPSLTVHSQAL